MHAGDTGTNGLPWRRVNLAAQRYCDGFFGRKAMCSSEFPKAIDALQPERKFFQICDSNYADAFDGAF